MGQVFRAFGAHHAQQANSLGVDLGFEWAQDFDHHINLPASQGVDDRRGAVVGDDLRDQVGLGAQQFGRQVLCAADVDGADVQLTWVGAAKTDQLGQGFVGRGLGHHDGKVKQTE